ncbi:hypothetical protein [Propioniciclava flava]|uniref:Uncharacterized protein n=1 Tax=Propioniciclava flava TaxID=2072026 RepID=A0A4Q2EI17_9ACTN|nr:hypothetical protein [Propioniciclava flava]RXW32222.1 hypothetical protein C1706_06530 [Propioniciclava flava]
MSISTTPVPKAGDTLVSTLGGETWTVPNTGDKTKMAKAAALVAALNAPEIQTELATKRKTVPTRLALLDDFKKPIPFMAPFADSIKTARARTGELGPDWPKAATKIYTAIQLALAGGKSPSDALAEASNG